MRGIQSNTMIFMRPGQPGRFSFIPKGRTYSPPRRGGGIACGNCALCEADAAPAGALWTMLQGIIVHAVGSMFCFIYTTRGWRFATPSAACLRKTATGGFIAVMGIASSATPIFFLRKRNKNAEGRKDGENEWLSTTWKQRWSAEVRGVLRLPLPLI